MVWTKVKAFCLHGILLGYHCYYTLTSSFSQTDKILILLSTIQLPLNKPTFPPFWSISFLLHWKHYRQRTDNKTIQFNWLDQSKAKIKSHWKLSVIFMNTFFTFMISLRRLDSKFTWLNYRCSYYIKNILEKLNVTVYYCSKSMLLKLSGKGTPTCLKCFSTALDSKTINLLSHFRAVSLQCNVLNVIHSYGLSFYWFFNIKNKTSG